ncbi:hypothetical protein Caci_2916 [Catenulispora acidiphila DSM 44928]|uniref:Uncharacterized protein n=1 Tax=Catenulispora acidiphila (strain DSM 44928 / JCM 14897 / NBRC 102108 / NRRL B-24433 / ID139908) TaxID=479433 RepID=C7Q2T3_CATAD|nr:hypothetical protein [Catenulispora acidiphila]ACU71825.1 hypothetical protein Caci_2916 [Catenulispora acidiphila DSM 44928]
MTRTKNTIRADENRPSAAILESAREARRLAAGSGASATATLIVSGSYSNCGFCGAHAFSHQETHETVAGYGPALPGRGARFTAITSDRIHIDDELGQRLAQMRPDLPVVDWLNRGVDMPDAVTISAGTAVPARSCPKCGSDDTAMNYCDGCRLRPYSAYDGNHLDNKCADGDTEHFHRSCGRCRYQWRTDDVINAREVCKR